jgi:hypothetical protein
MAERSMKKRPPNKLVAKVPGARELLRGPDAKMKAKIERAMLTERTIYLRQMAKDIDSLILMLTDTAKPSALWALAHELRCMGGTYGYVFLSEVAQILCQLIRHGTKDRPLPADVAQVFADAFMRGRALTGTYGAEDETVLVGLRKVAKQYVGSRA